MRLLFIILILTGWVGEALAEECSENEPIIVTNPRAGAHIFNDGITIRGFLCVNYPLIEVRNETTDRTATSLTTEICDNHQCTYHFAVPMRSLALGINQIRATVPGEDPPIEAEVEIMRTAFAEDLELIPQRNAPFFLALLYNEYTGP